MDRVGQSPRLGKHISVTHLQHQRTNLRRRAGDDGTRLLKGSSLIRRGSLTATDDGSGVSHTTAGRCGSTGDKADYGLGVGPGLVVLLQVFGGLFLPMEPPISPMRTIPSVRGSSSKTLTTSMC